MNKKKNNFSCIIAGNRSINNYSLVCKAIFESGWEDEISSVICGMATGVDLLGKIWGEHRDLEIIEMPANWKNIKAKGAIIRKNKYGSYNAAAGVIRNEAMAKKAKKLNGRCIVIWNGDIKSGSANMILNAHKYELPLFTYLVKK